MKLRNSLALAVYGLLILCILISWSSVLILDIIAVVPLHRFTHSLQM